MPQTSSTKTTVSNETEKAKTTLSGHVGWRCASNIALVKYWGKHPGQLPANPSVSFTLANAVTQTTIDYEINRSKAGARFYFEGKRNLVFERKIMKYLDQLQTTFPFLKETELVISSHNTFPHSSGIASSASSFGALALCLCSIEAALNQTDNEAPDNSFFEKASSVARLGSGSASRSVYGGFCLWGETPGYGQSSDEKAIPVPITIHENFKTIKDAILLVDKTEKSISSTQGHNMMKNHPYAEKRFAEARKNVTSLLKIMEKGDLPSFFRLVEHEALSLHAMMMTSNPGFILLKPNTLQIIGKITKLRESYGIPLCFTLDAGANVHVLYTQDQREKIEEIIANDFSAFCEKDGIIYDNIGQGPVNLLNDA